MAIGSETFWANPATGDGSNRTFTFSFPVASTATSEIVALVDDVVVGNYTISMNDPLDLSAGGSVVFDSGYAPANATTVKIIRRRSYLQEDEYTAASAVNGDTLESSLDKIGIQIQQVAKTAIRFSDVYLPDGMTGAISGTPTAGYIPQVNDTATGLEWAANNGSSSLVTADGSSTARTLAERFARTISPRDFGATGDAATNDATAVQAAIDFVRAQYSETLKGFLYELDFQGQNYRVESSIDLTDLRQPGLRIRNGGLYGACANKVVFDLSGTNAIVLEDFLVAGDSTSVPAVGILQARTNTVSSFPAAAHHVFRNVRTTGYFTKAAVVNFASEVARYDDCYWDNKSRSLTAYTYITCAHAGTLDDYVSGLTSEHATIPAAANGSQSNIQHYLGTTNVLRNADYTLAIQSITKANPAVVTLASGAISANSIVNGDKVWLHDVAGMTQLNNAAYTVANVSGDTFELQGVDSSAYGTFTSGSLRNQTGPAVLLGGSVGQFVWPAGYILTYGSPSIVVDMDRGTLRQCFIRAQCEHNAPKLMDFDNGSGTTQVIQGMELDFFSMSQTHVDCIIDSSGADAIRWDGGYLKVRNMGTAPTNKMFGAPSQWTLHDVNVISPLAAALNTKTDFADFDGRTIAYDTYAETVLTSALTHEMPVVSQLAGGGSAGFTAAGEGNVQLLLSRYSNNASMPEIYGRKARGTIGTPATLAQSDVMLRILAQGYASSAFRTGAYIEALMGASSPSSSDMETYWRILGCPAGSASASEIARLRHANGLQMYGANTVVDSDRLFQNRVYTVATLPSGAAGKQCYASDLRVFNGAGTQEGAGVGTGGVVQHNGTAWKIAGTNVTAVA